MKKMYWRPQRVSLRVIVLLALVSAGAVAAVETFRVRQRQPLYPEKRAAARLALKAFVAIKEERLKRRIAIDEESDPAKSGLIGELITPVTTNTGHLAAKQTTINPNFAAVVVDLLARAGVTAGDTIAVGLSGSFPALNIAVYAAATALKLRPLVITSVGSSQWGANHPKLMWPEMEKIFREQNIFRIESLAITPGGVDDRALGLSDRGRRTLDSVMQRSGVPVLDIENFEDSLNKRMGIYLEQAGDTEIRAYVNVGGGTISVGTSVGKHRFRPGLNRSLPRGGTQIDSVMTRFLAQDIAVIHLSGISTLAQRYGLPLEPTVMPVVGEGKMFAREIYNPWLAAVALALVVLMLIAFLRLDLGHRLLHAPARGKPPAAAPPEPMV